MTNNQTADLSAVVTAVTGVLRAEIEQLRRDMRQEMDDLAASFHRALGDLHDDVDADQRRALDRVRAEVDQAGVA